VIRNIASKYLFLFLLLFICPRLIADEFADQDRVIEVEFQPIIVQGIETEIEILLPEHFYEVGRLEELSILINDEEHQLPVIDGKIVFFHTFSETEEMVIQVDDYSFAKSIRPIPIWMSILPPLIAILIALVFKEVYTALFIGLLVGTSIISYYQGFTFFLAIGKGILLIIDTYILESLSNTGHLSIIIFSMLIGATVNLITRNGGMKGVVNVLSKYARSARSGQFITWVLGIAIFFDDYANTLVVGNTMRPVTDRLNISREKLSYIVDSTAAPIAAIALVTTWIGAELGYIQDGINTLGLNLSAYNVFLHSLSYAFYPVFALLFILILVFKGRDFGPMLKAERIARQKEFDDDGDNKHSFSNKLNELEVDENIKARWFNAVIPVLVIILGTITGLMVTGYNAVGWDSDTSFSMNLSMVIGSSDSYKALLWSSISGTLIAVLITISQRLLSLKESVDSLINGFRTMLTAIVILVLAWALALITKHLHTADFISQVLIDIEITPFVLPATTFILSALVAFSTGSSWGTMAILYPLILPSSWLISKEFGLDYETSLGIFYNVVSTVLAGSVLGDHCSPISDTTILSSLASSCNHIDHVRTQLPYALSVGGVGLVFGTIPASFGVSSLILFPLGLIALYLLVRFVGKKVET